MARRTWFGWGIIDDIAGLDVVAHIDSRDVAEGRTSGWKYPYMRTTKYLPWFDVQALMYIDYYILPYWNVNRVCEFGGGNSTIWFAQRVEEVVTIETNSDWRAAILHWAEKEDLHNITLFASIKEFEDATTAPFDLTILDLTGEPSLDNVKIAAEATKEILALDNLRTSSKMEDQDQIAGLLAVENYLLTHDWNCFKETLQMSFLKKPIDEDAWNQVKKTIEDSIEKTD